VRRAVEKEGVEISNFGRFSKDPRTSRITFAPDENFYKEINIK
jgi:hypothetical protein